jgi:hypothetical protein
MTKWRDRRSECAKSDSKAYGTTWRRQKVRNWIFDIHIIQMLGPGIPESKNFDELKEFFSEKYICCAARSCFQYSSVYFFVRF